MNPEIKDKPTFVVGLLAAVLAFTSFKNELSNIKIDLGFCYLNLLQVAIIFFIILSLSAYFYALDYMRYGYGEKIKNISIFKWILPLANFLYVVALLFPLIILYVWMVSFIITTLHIPIIHIIKITYAINLIGGVAFGIISYLTSQILTKNIRLTLAKKLEEKGSHRFNKARQLYKKGFYAETILELFKVIEINISKKLEEKGYLTQNLGPSSLKLLSQKEKIITDKNISGYDNLKIMRNNCVHKNISFDKKQADLAFDIVESILDEIDKK